MRRYLADFGPASVRDAMMWSGMRELEPAFESLRPKLLGHADRRRVISDDHRPRAATKNLRILPTFLVDGVVTGTWRIERKGSAAALILEPFVEIPRKSRAELAAEGKALVSFAEPDARTAEVRFA